MTQQVWQVERTATDVTAQIQSLDYSTGRQTQFDSWAPGSLNFVIKNDVGQADNYELNEKITLTAVGTDFYQWFYVQEILYDDTGGAGGGSTATILCTDLLGRLGKISVFEKSLPSAPTLEQIDTAFEGLMPTGTFISNLSDGNSTAAGDAAYTGTALNRLNLNMVTEQGWLGVTDNAVYLLGRSDLDLTDSEIIFARTASGFLQLGYSNIKRIALGSNYLNVCTVTPPVAAAQNTSDAAGVAAYGTYGTELSSVDNTGAQALSLAQWQVYSRSDPDELSFQISVSDLGNDLSELFFAIFLTQPLVTVSYKNPGDATTYTSKQIMQGFDMAITPEATYMEIYTSPLTYTNFFILDSATFGVLGGFAVATYNQNIRYSKHTYEYNGEFATAGGRLGW